MEAATAAWERASDLTERGDSHQGRPTATARSARPPPLPPDSTPSVRPRPSREAPPRRSRGLSTGSDERRRKWLRAWSQDGESGLVVGRCFGAATAVLFTNGVGSDGSVSFPSRRLCLWQNAGRWAGGGAVLSHGGPARPNSEPRSAAGGAGRHGSAEIEGASCRERDGGGCGAVCHPCVGWAVLWHEQGPELLHGSASWLSP